MTHDDVMTQAPAAPGSTASPTAGQDAEPAAPGLTFLATLSIEADAPIEVGQTAEGLRRLIPISGGTVEGPNLKGRILPGGADFQLLRSPTLTELDAKYAIETDAGERLYIDNFGIRTGTEEDIAALVRGEDVDPARIYFRCTPRIHSGGPAWSWLASRIVVGSGVRLPTQVRVHLWVVD